LGGAEHDPTEVDAWNHPLADSENTATVSRSGVGADPQISWDRQFDPSDLFRFMGCSLVDERLFVPGHDRLRVFSAETGDILWTIQLPLDRRDGHRQLDSSPRIHGDRCILASLSSIYAVDTETGRPRWRFDLNSSTEGLTLLGNTVYVSARIDAGPRLVAIDVTSGRERWRTNGRMVPLAATDDALVVQSLPYRPYQHLVAVDPETGTQRWKSTEPLETRRYRELREGVAIADEMVFVTDDGSLVGFELQTGNRRWELPLNEEASSFRDRVAVAENIYVVQPDQDRVLCVSTAGDIRWDRELPGVEHGISVGSDYLYVAHRAGLRILEPDTAGAVASIDLAETPGHASTPVVDDGAVYGVAGDTVYRVRADE